MVRVLVNMFYVYILTNESNNVLYIGVTSDICERVYQHREQLVEGFTQKYNVHKLVYYEQFEEVYDAISREKQLKNWRRQWKIDLIEKENPDWVDLFDELC